MRELPPPLPRTCSVVPLLSQAGIPCREMAYVFHEGGGTGDAARQLGLDEHLVVKTLIFADGQNPDAPPVAALMHGPRRVSLRKLERLAARRRLRPASPDEVRILAGREPGGVSPFGLPVGVLVCIHSSIRDLEAVYCNAGVRGLVVRVSPSAFDTFSPLWGDIMTHSAV